MSNIHSDVQNYYGQQLQQSSDLKTDACCTKVVIPLFIRKIIGRIHPDIIAKYYGCGLVFPPKLENCRVVDLGCGSGRDVYIVSHLVGSKGFVVGVDMTKEQLDVARQFVSHQTKEFQFDKPNVDFRLGKIEDLVGECQLETNSFDVVISNCVVNLSPDKKKVLEQVYQVLKVGGEFYFSDVYSDRPVPEDLRKDKVLWGECLSGALCEDDLISAALELGFTRPLLVTKEPIEVNNPDLQKLIGDIRFSSCTYRMFKNTSCTSNASLVTYVKPIEHNEGEFQLDQHYIFKINDKPHRLSEELTHILKISRYAEHFQFDSNDEEKETAQVLNTNETKSTGGCCAATKGCC